jgi:hypothetical protein
MLQGVEVTTSCSSLIRRGYLENLKRGHFRSHRSKLPRHAVKGLRGECVHC